MGKFLSYRILVISAVFYLATQSLSAEPSDEANRYFNRGMAAVEMAKTPEDYELAIEEFKRALISAPDWPDVYYNLGLIQEKDVS